MTKTNKFARHKSPLIFLFYTIAYLLIASGVGFISLMSLALLLGLTPGNNPIVPFAFMFPGFTIGGTLWANAIFKTLGISKSRKELITVGLGYGGSFALFGYGLELIEQYLFRRHLLNESGAHLQFLISFSVAIFSVATITSLVIRAQVSKRLNKRPNFITGGLAALTFVAVDLAFFLFGWQVGNPDFPQRSTMLIVMGLGITLSFLVGGTLTGLWALRDVGSSD
jgi:hypothetical protein